LVDERGEHRVKVPEDERDRIYCGGIRGYTFTDTLFRGNLLSGKGADNLSRSVFVLRRNIVGRNIISSALPAMGVRH
jgi:hypothetical protein